MRLKFCVACGAKGELIHHALVPLSRGGRNVEANKITLCRACHHLMCGYQHRRSELTVAGIQASMARGTRFGRPRKLRSDQVLEALARHACGETYEQIAKHYGVSERTIIRLVVHASGKVKARQSPAGPQSLSVAAAI
jgi:DNA-binding NarL/FixJ family response regulator